MHAARLELGERLRRVAAPLPRHVLVRAHRRPLDLRSAREAARADHARERPGNEKGSACASGALRAQGALRGGRALSRCRLRVLGRRRVAAQVEVGDAEAVGGAEDGADVKCRAQVVEHEHERQPQVLGPRRGRVVRRHEKVVVMAALGVPSLDREDEVEEVALVKVEPVHHARHQRREFAAVGVLVLGERCEAIAQQREAAEALLVPVGGPVDLDMLRQLEQPVYARVAVLFYHLEGGHRRGERRRRRAAA
mmetsp:Transcript_61955/g.184409  ORF Transcript_61955/g.184409 Transcript_61955/m.184409 type:complete len:252 (-) Transcript_61955:13-768(-)